MDEHEHLASLRPSRIRAVQAGAPFWTQVDLVDIDGTECDALRSGLEQFGIRTRRTPVGQARHLVAALTEPTDAEFVILLCHGEDGSIRLHTLAPEFDRHQPFHDRVTPDDLRSFARFDGRTVIATGCDTGHPELAQAILDCGASAYVAPTGGPFGYAAYFATISLFYDLTQERTLDEAVARLNQHDSELSMWRLYRR